MLFLSELTFVMELIAISLGLYFLFLAEKEKAKILKVAGYLLVVGGTLVMLESVFFGVKWWMRGVPPTGYPKMGGHQARVLPKTMGQENPMKYWCKQMEDKLENCNDEVCDMLRPMMGMCERFN